MVQCTDVDGRQLLQDPEPELLWQEGAISVLGGAQPLHVQYLMPGLHPSRGPSCFTLSHLSSDTPLLQVITPSTINHLVKSLRGLSQSKVKILREIQFSILSYPLNLANWSPSPGMRTKREKKSKT